MRFQFNRLSLALACLSWLLVSTASGQEAVLDATSPAMTPSKTFKTLVWSDEFDGEQLDRTKWNIEVNAFGGGNQELQLYTDRPENVRVEGGNLIIEARKDRAAISGTEREYSSGRVRSKKRGDWKYGQIDVRARVPDGQGIWSAIWMLPSDEKYGGWAASGEIDIMEMKGQEPDTVLGTLHYGDQWPRNTHSGDNFKLDQGTFADDFHVFSIVWTEGQIDWLIDGKKYQTQTKWSTAGAAFPAPFDQEFHLILNVAVGGNFLGSPDASTQFPCQMEIDYVRVYQ